jgi:methionine biosynthesis protein MetW
MFYFAGTRKPDFSSIKKIDYTEYWRARGFSLNAKLKEREVIIFDSIKAGSKILDIGCGNSLLPVKLKHKGVHVTVSDISDEVLKGYAAHDIASVQMDLEKPKTIGFGEKYDYIILSEVLEHLTNPEEVLRALAPFTGKFILTIPNSAFYRFRFHLMFSGRFFTQWVYHPSEHVRFWSHSDFLDWLSALGFRVVRTEASNGLSLFGIPLYRYWPNLFGHQICYFVETH